MNLVIILNMVPHQKLAVRLAQRKQQRSQKQNEPVCLLAADSASSLYLESNNLVLWKIHIHVEENTGNTKRCDRDQEII